MPKAPCPSSRYETPPKIPSTVASETKFLKDIPDCDHQGNRGNQVGIRPDKSQQGARLDPLPEAPLAARSPALISTHAVTQNKDLQECRFPRSPLVALGVSESILPVPSGHLGCGSAEDEA